MKFQPPDNNNPCNPLHKVAALSIDWDENSLPGQRRAVVATLNFKRSNDLRGTARLRNGEEITVCFGLSLSRASLELSFGVDGRRNSNSSVKVKTAAYGTPLQVKESVKDERRSDVSADVSAEARLALDGTVAGAVDGKTRAGSGRKRTEKRSFDRSNINVTFAGNSVHWEINPKNVMQDDVASGFLEGELFDADDAADRPIACAIQFSGVDPGEILARGAVFTLMENMRVANVRFLDDLGSAIPFGQVARETKSSRPLDVLSDQKVRLVKQIVRKHLSSQGMLIEGARVEICRAEA